ncbi:MAG: ATP-binding protein, partial [Clostridiales bacterium]|nr:ATP-binding protein [Clostridiales bacterium]
MKQQNEMSIKFLSRSANEAFARAAVAAFAAQTDPTLEELNDIKTAVSEGVTNAIIHAYPDIVGIVWIRVRITDENKVIINTTKECSSYRLDRRLIMIGINIGYV